MKSHDVIFETRSIWTQNPRDNLKNLEAQPRGFWDCREGFEQNTPRQSQKPRGAAERFLRFSRGVFCWNWTRGERYRSSSGGNEGRWRAERPRPELPPERERYRSPRVQFQSYTSSFKNYIVRFRVYTLTVDYLKHH